MHAASKMRRRSAMLLRFDVRMVFSLLKAAQLRPMRTLMSFWMNLLYEPMYLIG